MSEDHPRELDRPPQGIIGRWLAFIERAGNMLPHPGTLFAGMAVLVVVLSGIFSALGLWVRHPGTGERIEVVNLLNVAGLHRIMETLVTNFTDFAPLGTVLVAMIGIGIAESCGLIGAGLRLLVLKAPDRLLTFTLVFAGVLSNAASEIGYVLVVPLGATIFMSVGRHPIAGMAAAFAGVSGGYSANLMLGTIDPLLSGLSTEAAQIVDPAYLVNPACNIYFMAASTFFIAYVGTWVTEKIVMPRFGRYEGAEKADALQPLTAAEKRGLWFALAGLLVFAAFIVWGIGFAEFLRFAEDGTLDARSPLLEGVVAMIFAVSTLMSLAYGIGARTIRSDGDVIEGMGKALATLGSYMVLVFFAAQFVAFFKWTNLGLIAAVKGAEALEPLRHSPIGLMIGFVFVAALMNLVMGSASAKWSIMAPIFVPMFMLLGVSPELTQVAYRIGDSTTNIISPMMSYFALIVAFFVRYDRRAGIGTVVATMLPYTVAFLIVWSIMLGIWVVFELPLGVDAPLTYRPPASP